MGDGERLYEDECERALLPGQGREQNAQQGAATLRYAIVQNDSHWSEVGDDDRRTAVNGEQDACGGDHAGENRENAFMNWHARLVLLQFFHAHV